MTNKKDLIKEIKMSKTLKPNYKDAGTCLRYKNKTQIFRSKFKTENDAKYTLNKLKNIDAVNPKYVVYKCPECGYWHFGLKEWSIK